MEEEWRQIVKFKKYEVSSYGNIRNYKTKKLLTLTTSKDGYVYVTLYGDNKIYKNPSVHTLVCSAFHLNPDKKPTVHHKDFDSTNNNKDNLIWATYKEQNNTSNKKKKEKKLINKGKAVWKCDLISNQPIELFESVGKALISVNEENHHHAHKITKHMNNAYGFSWKYDNADLPNEIWKDLEKDLIKGIIGYKISTYGRIKNEKNIIIEGGFDKRGYKITKLKNELFYVHGLMGKSWFERKKEDCVVNHKDGNKSNCILSNLEVCTKSKNTQHAYDNGMIKKIKKCPVLQVDLNFNIIEFFDSYTKAENITGINRGTIQRSVKSNKIGSNFRWYSSIKVYEKEKSKITPVEIVKKDNFIEEIKAFASKLSSPVNDKIIKLPTKNDCPVSLKNAVLKCDKLPVIITKISKSRKIKETKIGESLYDLPKYLSIHKNGDKIIGFRIDKLKIIQKDGTFMLFKKIFTSPSQDMKEKNKIAMEYLNMMKNKYAILE